MMEQLIYEIAGIKYLLMERQLTASNKSKIEEVTKKHSCIWQGIKDVQRGGFLSDGYAIVKLLVPENEVLSFNDAL